MKIEKKLIKELKGYLDEFGLSEIEYQDGNKKIKVAKNITSNANITAHKPGITKTIEEESATKVKSRSGRSNTSKNFCLLSIIFDYYFSTFPVWFGCLLDSK